VIITDKISWRGAKRVARDCDRWSSSLPHMTHTVNQHDRGSALVHNSFALIGCQVVFEASYEAHNQQSEVSTRSAMI